VCSWFLAAGARSMITMLLFRRIVRRLAYLTFWALVAVMRQFKCFAQAKYHYLAFLCFLTQGSISNAVVLVEQNLFADAARSLTRATFDEYIVTLPLWEQNHRDLSAVGTGSTRLRPGIADSATKTDWISNNNNVLAAGPGRSFPTLE
jgi:hypothetical protein